MVVEGIGIAAEIQTIGAAAANIVLSNVSTNVGQNTSRFSQ